MVWPAIFSGAGLRRVLPQAQPAQPPGPQQKQGNPLQDQAQDLLQKAREQAQKAAEQMAKQTGMKLLVVEGAKIICSETNPAREINTLKVPEPRSVVEGKRLAQVQDVKRDQHIAPWKCECKKRPKPGGGYLPCDYKPQGMWTPGVQTETNDARDPKQRSESYQKGYENGRLRGAEGVDAISNNAGVQSALQNAAANSSRSFQDLATMSIIESGGNPLAISPSGRHFGLFQMGSGAAQQVGMSLPGMRGGSQAAMNNNALGGARYMESNAAALARYQASGALPSNVPIDARNLYMAHQQGPRGFSDLMTKIGNNPNAPLTFNQAEQGVAGATNQSQFKDYFDGKYDGVRDQVEKKWGKEEGSGSAKKQEQAIPENAFHKCVLGGIITIVDPGQRTKKAKLGGASMKP